MSKKATIILIAFLSICTIIFSQQTEASNSSESTQYNEPSTIMLKLNKYLSLNPDDEKLLNDLFTINIGIMKFKSMGNLKDINPLDSQNLVDSIKNELDKVNNIRLDKKSAALKALNVFYSVIGAVPSDITATTVSSSTPSSTGSSTPSSTPSSTGSSASISAGSSASSGSSSSASSGSSSSASSGSSSSASSASGAASSSSSSASSNPAATAAQIQKSKERIDFLRQKLFFSKAETDESILNDIFLELKENEKFVPILRQWVENLENPFYTKNLAPPFERELKSEESICNTIKINGKGPIDFLFYGEIEKVENYYFINLYVYSSLLKKRVDSISYVAENSNISERTMEKLKLILPKIFLINYAALSVNTEDENIQIYLDDDYIGRKNVNIDYIVPGNYIVTLKKDGYKDFHENVKLDSFDDKKIKLEITEKENQQVINFYIEPLGTQIFLNSVYQGKTPFKKALPKGEYILYARNDLYENHRYDFSINEISNDDKTIVFHLKSKDIPNYFKLKKTLYYLAFWNLTFSMIVTVPLIVLTTYFYQTAGSIKNNEYLFTLNSQLYYNFYAASGVMVGYTLISLGLLIATLVNYLFTLEKKDFIPILEFYKNQEGKSELSLGLNVKL